MSISAPYFYALYYFDFRNNKNERKGRGGYQSTSALSDLTSGPSAQEVVRYGRVEHVIDGRVTGVAVLRRLPELSVVPAHDLDPGIPPRN